uniref:Uncharacterized protein n=1 Tax=Ananas comosus var. bracteatus TaxID=296719 RepID=A0A6V7NSQ6_ANACO|nr:unnamed protein product [Ananas comosus var. bracteatus]
MSTATVTGVMPVMDGPRFVGTTDIIPNMATSTVSTEGVAPLAMELARVRRNLAEFKIGNPLKSSDERMDFVLEGSSSKNVFGKRPRSNVEGGSLSNTKPPKHPRTQSSSKNDSVVRRHRGHLRRDCPRGNGQLRGATSPLVTSLQAIGEPVFVSTQPMNAPVHGSAGQERVEEVDVGSLESCGLRRKTWSKQGIPAVGVAEQPGTASNQGSCPISRHSGVSLATDCSLLYETERRSELPWVMLTSTGPLGTARAWTLLRESVHFDKITEAEIWAEPGALRPVLVAQKVCAGVYKDVTTSQLAGLTREIILADFLADTRSTFVGVARDA